MPECFAKLRRAAVPAPGPSRLSQLITADLVAEDLACRRGMRLVFAGVSFRLAAGGALVLTGANGSGKSSLLRLAAGLLAPEAGRLCWGDAPVGPTSPGTTRGFTTSATRTR